MVCLVAKREASCWHSEGETLEGIQRFQDFRPAIRRIPCGRLPCEKAMPKFPEEIGEDGLPPRNASG